MNNSSSESEDDCYGNVAMKLKSLKNKYQDDQVESANLLNDTNELDEIERIAEESTTLNNTNELDEVVKIAEESTTSSAKKRILQRKREVDPTFIPSPDEMIEHTRRLKRNKIITRSCRRKPAVQRQLTLNETQDLPQARESNVSNRVRRQDLPQATESNVSNRGRRRGRSRRNQRNRQTHTNIPVYSVGNTAEYPDMSDAQELFSNNPTSDIIEIEDLNESIEENEELNVKVIWQSSEYFQFTVRKYQSINQIFNYFSEKEKVSNEFLLFTYNDRILKPNDTPDSINYRIVKFIEGGIVHHNVAQLATDSTETPKDGIIIKLQCQNIKKPLEMFIRMDDKLRIAMMKYAEVLEMPLNKLKFEFDGDNISGKLTPRDLDLEGGECIDVKILS